MQYRSCTLPLLALMCATSPTYTRGSDYIVPLGVTAAATGLAGFGIYQYNQWSEHRNVEDVSTQLRDADAAARTHYHRLMSIWQQQSRMQHHDWIGHMIASLEKPFEDGFAQLKATITTIETLTHRAQSIVQMEMYPELNADLKNVINYARTTQSTLEQILLYLNQHYYQFMAYDVVFGSRHLYSYYSIITSYYEQYPEPHRWEYIDQALQSQYASTRINWPRVKAVDDMAHNIKALDRARNGIRHEIHASDNHAVRQVNNELIETIDRMLYQLKAIHMAMTHSPSYHAERDGYYQEQREREHEERMQAMYQQQIDAERDRAKAERDRAAAEQERAKEQRNANKLREQAYRWGVQHLPEIRRNLERLADACRHNNIPPHRVARELYDIIEDLPEERSNISIGLEWLLRG